MPSFADMSNEAMTARSHGIARQDKVVGKSEQAEAVLGKMIRSGRWKEKLPGSRTLAAMLGISGGTLAKVLKRLETAGLIEGAGLRTRYRIRHRSAAGAVSEPEIMTLLVIIPKMPGKHTVGQHWQLAARLSDLLVPKRWRVRFHTANMGGGVIRHRHWDRLLAMENPDAVVAILGDGMLAKWATRRELRILFCGGNADGNDIPVIGISTASMLEHALGELMNLGHARIAFPLCNRSTPFIHAIRAKFRDVSSARGLPFREGLQTPAVAFNHPKELRRIFRRVDGEFQPTAWICLDWAEFLWVKRQLESQGYRIPADVSLVCLSSDETVDWIEPTPSHFKHPLERMAREMAKWVSGPRHGLKTFGSKEIAGTWIPGQTIGPAKN
ncbi:MAG: substrate-binding domain-containing protein [Luteolibacter sp.]|uniref:substrate-binding domain-containing protein n=1 Tax=Luteolibacter sp. TaxID=1962973 RepID=UPI00326522BA